MNLILFFPHELSADNTLLLNDHRYQHLRDTLGVAVGDSVRVGVVNGSLGTAEVLRCDAQAAELTVQLGEQPPAKLPLHIVLALPRPKMIRRIFRTVAELGIPALHIINSYRVDKSYWQSPALSNENIMSYLLDGLQQCRDTVVPEVHFHRLFKPFVEDELPGIAAGSRKLIAHPIANTPCPMAIDEPVILAIGPEGGFIPYEVEKFIEAGFETIHLGQRILKVENAVTALTSRLYSV